MIDAIQKIVAPLQRRVMLMIGRAVINAVTDDAKMQMLQVSLLSDEVREGVERMAEYGFSSVPKPGAQALIACVGGDRGHGVVIATGDARYRIKSLSPGEVALYTDEGDKIVLKRGKIIEVTTDQFVVKAATKIRFETPVVEATQKITSGTNMEAGAMVKAVGDIQDNTGAGNTKTVANMRSTYNGHTHNDPQGGAVGTPNQQI